MANNIRAVSPSLFSFSRESLSLSPARYHLFARALPATRLSSSVPSFSSASASFRERVARCGAGPRSQAGSRTPFWIPSRQVQERDTSGAPRLLLLAVCVRGRVCGTKVAFLRAGYVWRWRLLSDDAGKKGVIRGLLKRAPCTL